MKRATRDGDLLKLRDVALPQMLLTDYRQASGTLDELAIKFRTRESQLRKLIKSPESRSSSARANAARHVKSDAQVSKIALFFFGKFRVEVLGIPVKTGGRNKAIKILKFLAQRRRPCPGEMLMENLWPECKSESASNRLRVEVHALRKMFSADTGLPNIIVYRDGCYELNCDMDIWSDADEFEAFWQKGIKLEADNHHREAAECYEQAASLYQGNYLEEDLYEEWTLFRREVLRDAYLYLLGKLAVWCGEQGNYGSCISYSHKMLTQDPYREDAYRLLMGSYNALGQKATALHWYDVCLANLHKGLNVIPSPATTRLRNQII